MRQVELEIDKDAVEKFENDIAEYEKKQYIKDTIKTSIILGAGAGLLTYAGIRFGMVLERLDWIGTINDMCNVNPELRQAMVDAAKEVMEQRKNK